METIKQELEIEYGKFFFSILLEYEVVEGDNGLGACGYSILKIEATDENNVKRLFAEDHFLRRESVVIAMLGIPLDIWNKEILRAGDMAQEALDSKLENERQERQAGEFA